MESYSCDVCGYKWQVDKNYKSDINLDKCINPDVCIKCYLDADKPRKDAKVLALFEKLENTEPLSHEEAIKKSSSIYLRVHSSIVEDMCNKHGWWPYAKYKRGDNDFGYIISLIEPN